MASAKDVAAWMVAQVNTVARLRQTTAVRTIRHQFGEEFSYRNENRNWAIVPEVLAEFEKLAPADVVKWAVGGRYWRLARAGDPDSRAVRR